MSHVTDGKVRGADLDALEACAGEHGLELVRGQQTYRWYGRFMNDSEEGRRVVRERGLASLGKCTHALRLKDAVAGSYEIGVIEEADGTFSLIYDTFGPGRKLTQVAGEGLAKLHQSWAAERALRAAKQKLSRLGFVAQRETLPNGVKRIRMVRR